MSIVSQTCNGQRCIIETFDDAVLLVYAIQIDGTEEFDDIRFGHQLQDTKIRNEKSFSFQ